MPSPHPTRLPLPSWSLALLLLLSLLSLLSPLPAAPSPRLSLSPSPVDNAPRPRIVSFSPALTHLLFDMGLGDHVVGVTRYCQLPPGIDRPRLGDAQTVNAELILGVRPDLLFVQNDPRNFNGVTDIDPHVRLVFIKIESLLGIPKAMNTILSEANQAGLDPQSARVANFKIESFLAGHQALKSALADALHAGLQRPRVLFVMGTDRPVAFGGDSFLGDLIELLGGVNAGADIPGRGPYRQTDIDRILAARPDVLICQVAPGQEPAALQYWNQWRDLPPARTGRLFAVSDPNWTIPSTRLLPLGAQLGYMIHAPARVQVLAGMGTLDATHARLLRLLAAALVGAALAAAGMALQGLLRNPLAEPFVLGISSGAGVGVLLGLALAGAWLIPAWATTPVLAFAGAILTCLAVYAIAQRRGQLNPYSLILAGVIINSFNAAIMLAITLYLDPDRIADFSRWAMGRFPDSTDLSLLALCAASIAAGWLLLLFHAPSFNVLSLGDEVANSSGVRVHRLQILTFAAVGLMTAAAVALAGPIAFLGLIVPHICRMIFGPDHRKLVVISGLAGAVFLAGAEWLCRAAGPLVNVSLIPVGIITALAGGPFFIFLLRRRFQETVE